MIYQRSPPKHRLKPPAQGRFDKIYRPLRQYIDRCAKPAKSKGRG
jgi:hypothetical protein